jgi:hypothetical protein
MTQAASPAQRLKALAPAAVIGAERGGGSPGKVLAEAARAAVHARAGYKPTPVKAELPACPRDATPAATGGTAAVLQRLLNDPDAGLIEEWAQLAQARRQRVPDGSVPALIDWWSRQPRRSEAVFAVLGQRGLWLASLNPDWRKPVALSEIPPNAEELWSTGTGPERAALLKTIRRHDPARGLAIVKSTWSADGADDRCKFVEALERGRSMADEPFLEAALDDRSKLVRRAAAAVLGRIIGSGLRARMTDRARRIIRVERQRKGLLRREVVTVALERPQAFDPSWERDGVEEAVAGGGMGQRAWWSHQILRYTDLAAWSELSGLAPAALLESLDKDDAQDVSNALTHAAIASGDLVWAEALLRWLLSKGISNVAAAVEELAEALPASRREPLMLEVAQASKLAPTEMWTILAASDEPWSAQFSKDAMDALKKAAPAKRIDGWSLTDHLDHIAYRIAPGAADAFEQAVAAHFGQEHTPSIQRIIDRLRLRAEMHKEFGA